MVTEFQGQRIAATMRISVEDGELPCSGKRTS